jgi:hypothetical protein
MRRSDLWVFAVGLVVLCAQLPAASDLDDVVPGELLVLFVDRESTVMDVTSEGPTSVYLR